MNRLRKNREASLNSDKPDYIAYPRALKLLTDRINATPEEIAAWVWMGPGPDDGGLAAYLNAKELVPPPRFNFDYYMGDDYLSPLMACSFLAADIAKFQPKDRYITGEELIKRWRELPGIQVEAFIQAKIAESRLLDMHPVMGATQWSESENFPSKELALFVRSQVEAIEAEDFDHNDTQIKLQANPCRAVSAGKIMQHFVVIKSDPDSNDVWWKRMMRNASDNGLKECRVGKGKKGLGGSLWRPDLTAVWLGERQARGCIGLSTNAAKAALKKFAGCEDIVDDVFPSDE